MAFQQPQQRPQPAQRRLSASHPEPQQQHSPTRKRPLEESQEWILFSPHADDASRTATSQTHRTTTQLSDFGSLETHVRSQPQPDSNDDANATHQHAPDSDDESAELDSLDDGLHAFQHHPFSSSSLHQLDQSGGAVLPTHDGLGAFSAPGLQQQLWQFERYNPHRRRNDSLRRKTSLQARIDEVDADVPLEPEDDRTARIEKWRLDQSRAVLEEIERETRRRRRRMGRTNGNATTADHRSNATSTARTPPSLIQDEPKLAQQEPSESWWARITRRVIQDLIGLDDTTLSVIFGEQLPDPSPTPTQPSPLAMAAENESRVTFNDNNNYGWEMRLLERIARELGVLVNQLSHEHDGAFTNSRHNSDDTTTDAATPAQARDIAPRQPSLRQQRRHANRRTSTSNSDILFPPTLAPGQLTPGTDVDTSLWGIEEEPAPDSAAAAQRSDQNYWERDIDLQTIFTYLRRRLARSPPPQQQPDETETTGPLPAAWATERRSSTISALGSSPASQARAESIRRQHPLVHRAAERAAAQNRRRESLLRRHQMAALLQRARGSSCASHSTKRSRRTLSGSGSRHYWDLGGGGSLDSDAAFSAGAAGAWGEV